MPDHETRITLATMHAEDDSLFRFGPIFKTRGLAY